MKRPQASPEAHPGRAMLVGLNLPFVVVDGAGRVTSRSETPTTEWAKVGTPVDDAPVEWRRAFERTAGSSERAAESNAPPSPVRGVQVDGETWLVQVLDPGMLAAIAHEIKNPVAAVVGALAILNQRHPEGSAERQVIKEMQARLLTLSDRLDTIGFQVRPIVVQRASVGLLDLVRGAEHELYKRVPGFRLGDVNVPDVHIDVDRRLCTHALRLMLEPWARGPGPDLDGSCDSGRISIRLKGTPPVPLAAQSAAAVHRIASAHGGALVQGSTQANLGLELATGAASPAQR